MWLFWDDKIQCVPKTKITRMTYCKVLMTRLDTQTNHKVIFRGGKSDKGGFQLLDSIITELKSHMTC